LRRHREKLSDFPLLERKRQRESALRERRAELRRNLEEEALEPNARPLATELRQMIGLPADFATVLFVEPPRERGVAVDALEELPLLDANQSAARDRGGGAEKRARGANTENRLLPARLDAAQLDQPMLDDEHVLHAVALMEQHDARRIRAGGSDRRVQGMAPPDRGNIRS